MNYEQAEEIKSELQEARGEYFAVVHHNPPFWVEIKRIARGMRKYSLANSTVSVASYQTFGAWRRYGRKRFI